MSRTKPRLRAGALLRSSSAIVSGGTTHGLCSEQGGLDALAHELPAVRPLRSPLSQGDHATG